MEAVISIAIGIVRRKRKTKSRDGCTNPSVEFIFVVV
jgi:hypothetical protein